MFNRTKKYSLYDKIILLIYFNLKNNIYLSLVQFINVTMNNILHNIDMNIMKKKLELIKSELKEMDSKSLIMDYQTKEIKNTYDKLLYKKEPVGSSISAIKHLKQLR